MGKYQGEVERKTVTVWTRVVFMETTWDANRRYGTQSVMKDKWNQSIKREFLEKLMRSTESVGLTESVMEYRANEKPITRKELIKRAEKWMKRLKSKIGNK